MLEDDFNVTIEEVSRLKDALQDKMFCSLLADYAKEISDPVNKKKYEEEIIALERQRGQEVKLLKPEPGFVLKTIRLPDKMKVFVNICHSLLVDEVASSPAVQARLTGEQLSIPHALSGPRQDLDKSGRKCLVYDACFHPATLARAERDARFKAILLDTAMDLIERKDAAKLERNNKKFPKLRFKGVVEPSIVRVGEQKVNGVAGFQETVAHPIYEKLKGLGLPVDNCQRVGQPVCAAASAAAPAASGSDEHAGDENANSLAKEAPKYKLTYRGDFDIQDFTYSRNGFTPSRPKEIVIEFNLPRVSSASEVDLDVVENEVVLDSKSGGYRISIPLANRVNEDQGKAQFDKARSVLTVVLPIVYKDQPFEGSLSQPRLVQELAEARNDSEPSGDGLQVQRGDVSASCAGQHNGQAELNDVIDMSYSHHGPTQACQHPQVVPGAEADHAADSQICAKHGLASDDGSNQAGNVNTQPWEKSPSVHAITEVEVSAKQDLCRTDCNEGAGDVGKDALPSSTGSDIGDAFARLSIEGNGFEIRRAVNKDVDKSGSHQDVTVTASSGRLTKGRSLSTSDVFDSPDNLFDLQNDVIDDDESEGSFISSSTSLVFERSQSCDSSRSETAHNQVVSPRLRSILKRSLSSGFNSDYDYISYRTKSSTSADVPAGGSRSKPSDVARRRYKSVTFDEAPRVMEFTKLSKREWKRRQKELMEGGVNGNLTSMLGLRDRQCNRPPANSADDLSHATPGRRKNRKQQRKTDRKNSGDSKSRSEDDEAGEENGDLPTRGKEGGKARRQKVGKTKRKGDVQSDPAFQRTSSRLVNQLAYDIDE